MPPEFLAQLRARPTRAHIGGMFRRRAGERVIDFTMRPDPAAIAPRTESAALQGERGGQMPIHPGEELMRQPVGTRPRNHEVKISLRRGDAHRLKAINTCFPSSKGRR